LLLLLKTFKLQTGIAIGHPFQIIPMEMGKCLTQPSHQVGSLQQMVKITSHILFMLHLAQMVTGHLSIHNGSPFQVQWVSGSVLHQTPQSQTIQ